LTKIQNLLKHHDSENKQLGIQLLKAYCYSLNYAPTLLHVLEKGPRLETGERILNIKDRISKEVSKRMYDILRLNVLDYFLLSFTSKQPNFYKYQIRYRLWEPDQFGNKYGPNVAPRRYKSHRFLQLKVAFMISAKTPEDKFKHRKSYVSDLMRNIVDRKVRKFTNRLKKNLEDEKAAMAKHC